MHDGTCAAIRARFPETQCIDAPNPRNVQVSIVVQFQMPRHLEGGISDTTFPDSTREDA